MSNNVSLSLSHHLSHQKHHPWPRFVDGTNTRRSISGKKRTSRFTHFTNPCLFSPRKKDRSKLDTFVGDGEVSRSRGNRNFSPAWLRAGARGTRNMTVNFSRIHRAERMECPFIVSKRAASRQKPSTGIPFLRPNYSCHYTCGFLERAYSLSSRSSKRPAARPGRIRASLFSSPSPFFLSSSLSFFLSSFVFLFSQAAATTRTLMWKRFSNLVRLSGLQFCNP